MIVVGYPQDVSLSHFWDCLTKPIMWLETLQLGRSSRCLLLFQFALLLAPSSTVRESSPQVRGSQVSSCFIHPGSGSRVCGVFNPKVLHLSYKTQPRVMATVHFDLGDCYKAPAKPGIGILLDGAWLLWGTPSPCACHPFVIAPIPSPQTTADLLANAKSNNTLATLKPKENVVHRFLGNIQCCVAGFSAYCLIDTDLPNCQVGQSCTYQRKT